jgi:hypothetical protein
VRGVMTMDWKSFGLVAQMGAEVVSAVAWMVIAYVGWRWQRLVREESQAKFDQRLKESTYLSDFARSLAVGAADAQETTINQLLEKVTPTSRP